MDKETPILRLCDSPESNSLHYDVRDTLTEVLQDIDTKKINPTRIVIIVEHGNEISKYTANCRVSDTVFMCEFVKNDVISGEN